MPRICLSRKILKVVKYLFFLVLITTSSIVCFSQTIEKKKIDNCRNESIRLIFKKNVYVDTVIQLRNYINRVDDKKIMCSDDVIDEDIEKLIWDSD